MLKKLLFKLFGLYVHTKEQHGLLYDYLYISKEYRRYLQIYDNLSDKRTSEAHKIKKVISEHKENLIKYEKKLNNSFFNE